MGADTTPSHPADRGGRISDRSHRRMVSAPAHWGRPKDPPGGSLPERAGGAINFAGYGKRSTLPIDRDGKSPGGGVGEAYTDIKRYRYK